MLSRERALHRVATTSRGLIAAAIPPIRHGSGIAAAVAGLRPVAAFPPGFLRPNVVAAGYGDKRNDGLISGGRIRGPGRRPRALKDATHFAEKRKQTRRCSDGYYRSV